MKKFLLVAFIGIVFAINLYAIVNHIASNYDLKNLDRVDNGCTIVYVE